MSKPLELNVYTLREKVGRNARPGYVVGKRAVSLAEAFREGQRKRLADAELAAEYWFDYSIYVRECANVLSCQERYMEAAGVSFQEAHRKVMILHRFATLPHYDEATK